MSKQDKMLLKKTLVNTYVKHGFHKEAKDLNKQPLSKLDFEAIKEEIEELDGIEKRHKNLNRKSKI